MTETIKIVVSANTGGAETAMKRVSDSVTRMNGGIEKSAKGMNQWGAATSRSQTKMNRFVKGALQQAGFQVGDFAVQVANGTDKLQAFGQQGSQLLGIFGPVGALLGAGVAIVSAVGLAYKKAGRSLKVFSDEVSDLEDSMKSLHEIMDTVNGGTQALINKYGEATDAVRRLVESQRDLAAFKAIREARQMVSSFTKEVESSTAKIMKSTVGFDLQRRAASMQAGFGLTDEGGRMAAALMLVLAREKSMGKQLQIVRELRSELDKGNIALAEMTDQDFKFMEDLNQLEDSLTRATKSIREVDFSKFQSEAVAAFNAASTSAQRMTTEVTSWLDKSLPPVLSRTVDRVKTVSQAFFNMYDETVGHSWVPDMVTAIGEWFGKLKSLMVKPALDATAEVGDSFEDLNSGVAVTLGQSIKDGMSNAFTSIIDGTKSATNAFKDMARSVISSLYDVLVVQQLVGQFATANQKGSGILGVLGGLFGISGKRATGGQVTAGKSYLVGERGPELITPSRNAHVNTAGQTANGGNVIVHQTINVTTGVQQTVRSELMSLMPQISDSAKAAVLDARRRGGAFRGAF